MLDWSAATCSSGREASASRVRATGRSTSPPWPRLTSAVRREGSRPSSAAARSRSSSSPGSSRTIGSTRRAPPRRPTVGPRSRRRRQLARLEDGVESARALQRRRRGAGAPHRSPDPDRRGRPGGGQHVRERPVGMDPVEDDDIGAVARRAGSRAPGEGACSRRDRCLRRCAGRRRGSRPRRPASATTGAACESVKNDDSKPAGSRRAIAIARFRWPRPVPLLVAKRTRRERATRCVRCRRSSDRLALEGGPEAGSGVVAAPARGR